MNENRDRLQYLWNVHGYMNSYIVFADRKAGVFLAVATSVVGYQVTKASENWATLDWWLFYLTVATGVLSFASGLLVITPRLFTANPFTEPGRAFSQTVGLQNFEEGEIYWCEVAKFSSSTRYHNHLAAKGNEELASSIARHIHQLSTVLVYKYRFLDAQVKLLVLSLGPFAILFFRSN